jgi:hypothetical protein
LVSWDDDAAQPSVSLWQAEDIINWKVARHGQRVVLAELVLRDAGRVRVLKLVESCCVQEVWALAGSHHADGHQKSGRR